MLMFSMSNTVIPWLVNSKLKLEFISLGLSDSDSLELAVDVRSKLTVTARGPKLGSDLDRPFEGGLPCLLSSRFLVERLSHLRKKF